MALFRRVTALTLSAALVLVQTGQAAAQVAAVRRASTGGRTHASGPLGLGRGVSISRYGSLSPVAALGLSGSLPSVGGELPALSAPAVLFDGLPVSLSAKDPVDASGSRGGGTRSKAAGDSDRKDDPLAGLEKYAERVEKAVKVLTDPDTSDEEKSLEIDALFNKVDFLSSGGAREAAAVLKDVSSAVSHDQIAALLGEDSAGRAAHMIKSFLDRADPEDLKYRVSALVGLSRSLVSMEERALFTAISEEDGLKKGLDAAGGDAKRLAGQIQALVRLSRFVTGESSLEKLDKDAMKQVVADINDLGFFYIKVAQTLSNTAVVFSDEAVEELKVFQENVPPMPAGDVLQVIREEFGREAADVFLDFNPENPIASGSIAQVYRAKVRTWYGGARTVIVKVQRPGLKDTLDWNRKLNRVFLSLAAVTWDPAAVRLLDFIRDQVAGLEDKFEGELDFRAEARRMRWFRFLHLPQFGVKIPRVFGRYSTGRVLTMSGLPGENVDNAIRKLSRDEKNGDQARVRKTRRKLFSRLLGVLLYQIVVIGHMHADLHPGNILAAKGGRVGLIDWSQSFNTRGMVLLPARALYHLALGHPRRFGLALAAMGSADAGRKKAIIDSAEEIFARNKMFYRKARKFGNDVPDEEFLSEEHFSKLARSAGELLNTARKEHGYRMSPRYFQLLRSAVPFLGTMIALLIQMPGKDIARASLLNAALYLPVALAVGLSLWTLRLPFRLAAGVGRYFRRR